jgi:hypothetical protein
MSTRMPACSAARRPAEGTRRSHNCGLSRWSKTVPPCCLEPGSEGGVTTGKSTLAKDVLPSLRPVMLCLADWNCYGFTLWTQAHATGADLLWRIKKNLRLPCEQWLPDGSSLSRVYASPKGQRHGPDGGVVRVIDYTLEGVHDAEPRDRLLRTLLEHDTAPATELAARYHERWEIETALDELKTHLRGARMVLRSKTPDLVTQESYGLLLHTSPCEASCTRRP